ncbi:Peroxidase superfamily protein [Forsythia ovata]|uniref:peroxidase n=1 Tax=Forsythia ovata TaxID=205694 RepID=A0ABD1U5J4_9LAMI
MISYPLGARNLCPPAEVSAGGQRFLAPKGQEIKTRGCDGSILIDEVPDLERGTDGHQGVEGFGEIKRAKDQLEVQCRGVVCCADIVALAARDGGPFYDVDTGQRDGKISSSILADDMPEVDDPIDTLKSKFRRNGL